MSQTFESSIILIMASYSFKHVGNTAQSLEKTLKTTALPIGIKTPMQLGTSEGILVMHTSLENQLHDNFKNLLLTNWGERLNLYDFGANLRPITTELSSEEEYDVEAMARIQAAVTRWMPYITLSEFGSEDTKTRNGVSVKKITIVYDIPALNVTNKALQIVLNMI